MSDPARPQPDAIREAAQRIAAVSSPDCRCTFQRGALVKMCSLCAAGAEDIEKAIRQVIEHEHATLLAHRAVLREALEDTVLLLGTYKTARHCSIVAKARAALSSGEGRPQEEETKDSENMVG